MLALREFRSKAKALPDLLVYAALVDDGIVLGKDGSLMAAWEYRGDDLDSAGNDQLAAVSAQVNRAFARRGSGWMINVDATRVPSRAYPQHAHFSDRTTALIDLERRAQYEAESAHFETRYVLSVTYLAPSDAENRVALFFIDQDMTRPADPAGASHALELFRAALEEIEDQLSSVLRLRRLGSVIKHDASGRERRCDELLEHLNACIVGAAHPVQTPPVPMYLDAVLGNCDFFGGLAPRVDGKHLRCIGFSGFPSASYPGILDALNRLPTTYRWSTRFIFLDDAAAQKRIDQFRKKWFQKRKSLANLLREQNGGTATHLNGDADAMVSDAVAAADDLSSGSVKYGYYTSVIVLADEDAARVDAAAREMIKHINHLGFSARIETMNAVEAYLGSLPGHGYPNVRRPLMHTLNLADFLPLTSVWAGAERHPSPQYPKDAPPLAYARTSGATPFRLHLHAGDVGHTLIVGPTGSGKSTLLGLIAASHLRYRNARLFFFDIGNSSFALAQAAGAHYYDIAGEEAKITFCPLARIDVAGERLWAAEWIEALVGLQGVTVTPHLRKEIHSALLLLADGPGRTLTDLVHTLSEPVLREALSHYTLAGSLGSMLDARQDALTDGDFSVFEMQHLLALGEKNAIPVLLYLFHRIEQRLDGSPTLIILDEAWLLLDSPVFSEKIRAWLKTLRKANAAVVFATQSLGDIVRSRISDVIVESCPTKIFLANPEARHEIAVGAYSSMGLNSRQVEIIASMTPKRQYFFASPAGRRIFDLGLGPIALSFIGASGKDDIAAIRALVARNPDTWPAQWLAARGLTQAATAWMKIGTSQASTERYA